ncbi:MAG: hypothetical protein GY778_05830 [bacterium]|nr:hypothetical protein [bacterium]
MRLTTDIPKRVGPLIVADQRRALTVVEVLVAVATVALLVAALAPAMAGVRGYSKQTVCLQNLARIAEASIVYGTIDPDHQAVPIHPTVFDAIDTPAQRRFVAAAAWGGRSGRGPEDGDLFFWGTLKGRSPATRPLNKILYGDVFPDYRYNPGPGGVNWFRDTELDLGVYHCPSDSGYTGNHSVAWRDGGLSGYDHYGNSYATAVVFIYSSCGLFYESNSAFGHRLGDIPNPATTLYYLETCGRYAFSVDPPVAALGESAGPNTGSGQIVYGWHGQRWQFNAAFVDGHAEPVHIRGSKSPRLGRYPGGSSYDFWRYVIIRGDTWQMDTLPLAPVLTNIPSGGD